MGLGFKRLKLDARVQRLDVVSDVDLSSGLNVRKISVAFSVDHSVGTQQLR